MSSCASYAAMLTSIVVLVRIHRRAQTLGGVEAEAFVILVMLQRPEGSVQALALRVVTTRG